MRSHVRIVTPRRAGACGASSHGGSHAPQVRAAVILWPHCNAAYRACSACGRCCMPPFRSPYHSCTHDPAPQPCPRCARSPRGRFLLAALGLAGSLVRAPSLVWQGAALTLFSLLTWGLGRDRFRAAGGRAVGLSWCWRRCWPPVLCNSTAHLERGEPAHGVVLRTWFFLAKPLPQPLGP